MMQLQNDTESVKLDQILKLLFSTSKKVLLNLLNSLFEEDFSEDEIELNVTNNEFIQDTLDVIQGDMFFEISNSSKKIHYHIEFQTKNDTSMVIRTFEYGFKKSRELSSNHIQNSSQIKQLYFPKQKVIFFEKNKNIEDTLKLQIIFPNGKDFLYTVDVMKYWEYTDKDLIAKKMYPLLPLQLFNLRKDLDKAKKSNDINKIKSLSVEAKNLAKKLAYEAKELFSENALMGDDLHKMFLAITNLIEYLNNNYFNDDKLEDEVYKMTRTLYDPEVEKRGIEKGRKEGIETGKIEIAKNLFKLGVSSLVVIEATGLSKEIVDKIHEEVIKEMN